MKIHMNLPVKQEDLPSLVQIAANVFRHRIDVDYSYVVNANLIVVYGERHMIEKVEIVAADVARLALAHIQRWNLNAKDHILQENRKLSPDH